MNRVIAIGREFGSGGRELGRRVAETLRCAYYDREIVAEIAKRTSLAESYVQRIVEHRPISPFSIHIGRSFSVLPDQQIAQNQAVYQQQCAILAEMADKSDCVIVGRCADFLLRGKAPFRVFVYAEMASRVARCRANEPAHEALPDRELARRIDAIDRRRAEYYKFMTNQKWGDRDNYDLCLNTTKLPLAAAAKCIAELRSA